MRILYVLEHYHPYIGGAERLFQDLAENLSLAGHDITVVTTLYQRELQKYSVHNGVEIHRVKCYNRYLFTLFALFKVFGLKGKFDIVHATTYNAAIPAWFYSKLTGTRSFLTFHEVWAALWFKLPFLNIIERWGFYLYEQLILKLPFDRYIAVSNSTKNALIQNGIPQKKITQIYNGIDYSDFRVRDKKHPKDGTFHFLFFGRLGVSKGLDLLIPAFAKLNAAQKQTRLHLVIPRKPIRMFRKVMALITENNIRDKVILHHELPKTDLISLIGNSDAVVIPSYSEGFCFVAAETCALGVPVVHSGRAALSEVVTGAQIPFSPLTKTALCFALDMALKGQWQTKGTKKFHITECTANYIKCYNNTLNV